MSDYCSKCGCEMTHGKCGCSAGVRLIHEPVAPEVIQRAYDFSFSKDGGRNWVELNSEIRTHETKWPDDPPAPSYRSREGLDAPTDITADDASVIGRALRRFRRG